MAFIAYGPKTTGWITGDCELLLITAERPVYSAMSELEVSLCFSVDTGELTGQLTHLRYETMSCVVMTPGRVLLTPVTGCISEFLN